MTASPRLSFGWENHFSSTNRLLVCVSLAVTKTNYLRTRLRDKNAAAFIYTNEIVRLILEYIRVNLQ